MNSNELYNELKQLAKLGYLEQAQLERIQDEYMISRKEHTNAFLIFALIGVVFIGAGVISMFAYNWSMFSREMKAFIAFLPLLGVQGLLFLKIRAQASDVWIQSLTLALGIAFLSRPTRFPTASSPCCSPVLCSCCQQCTFWTDTIWPSYIWVESAGPDGTATICSWPSSCSPII